MIWPVLSSKGAGDADAARPPGVRAERALISGRRRSRLLASRSRPLATGTPLFPTIDRGTTSEPAWSASCRSSEEPVIAADPPAPIGFDSHRPRRGRARFRARPPERPRTRRARHPRRPREDRSARRGGEDVRAGEGEGQAPPLDDRSRGAGATSDHRGARAHVQAGGAGRAEGGRRFEPGAARLRQGGSCRTGWCSRPGRASTIRSTRALPKSRGARFRNDDHPPLDEVFRLEREREPAMI